jgi:hypothetical protein
VDAAAAALRSPPVTAATDTTAATTAATGTLFAAQQSAAVSLLQPSSVWSAGRLWGGRRRQEWALCFSSVPLRLSGRRKASVEGFTLVVPDNAEALLAGREEDATLLVHACLTLTTVRMSGCWYEYLHVPGCSFESASHWHAVPC